ncbi:MAG: hypothetical protein IPH83_13305 [Gammaproteobacteria bacterium]|nr:hypothetical protein [Gammaproteobacteria bacterium]
MTLKSHLDGFLLMSLFYELDMPPVHLFGGINMTFSGSARSGGARAPFSSAVP